MDHLTELWTRSLKDGTAKSHWSKEDYHIVAEHLAKQIPTEPVVLEPTLVDRVAALELNSHEPVDVRPQLRAIASDEYRRMTNDPAYREWVRLIAQEEIATALDGITEKLRRS